MTVETRPDNAYRAWLYDADGEDARVQLDGGDLPEIGDGHMLWVDIDLEAAKSAGDPDIPWQICGTGSESRIRPIA